MAAWTTEQYEALCEAISQGAREVWYGDKRVQYHSLDEMLKLKGIMEQDLGLKNTSNRSYGEFSKGLK